VLGAIADNRVGIVGTAPGAPLLSLHRGVDDLDIVHSIDEAVQRKARVLVFPWGWISTPSGAIELALKEAADAGVLIVTAAGDAGLHRPFTDDVQFPCSLTARIPSVCAGAAGPAGDRKDASSSDGLYTWRSAHSRVGPDLIAPGTYIATTDRRSALGYNTDATSGDFTLDFAGSGAAACYVAGVAASMIAVDETIEPREVKALLLRTARELAPASAQHAAVRLISPDAAVQAALDRLEERRRVAPEGPGKE
jgi:hypothetical protein